MKDIIVKNNQLEFAGKIYACAVGKAGFAADKREGDNCTPLGTFALREVFYRADKMARPNCRLPVKVIGKDDGWCDEAGDVNYNRAVKLPYPARHEKLWREDDVYNVVVPLGYNDAPVVAGRGSAIFMHVARSGYIGTEGCVALACADLLEVLRGVDANTKIVIS